MKTPIPPIEAVFVGIDFATGPDQTVQDFWKREQGHWVRWNGQKWEWVSP